MNTIKALSYAKALGFVAVSCLAQAVTVQYTAVAGTTVSEDPVIVAAPFRPMIQSTAPAARSCSSLDSFGNPVRPCRG